MTSIQRLIDPRGCSPRRGGRLARAVLLATGCTLGVVVGTGHAQAQQAAPGAAAPPGATPPELREERVQDWTVLCGTPSAGGPEQCEMRQQIADAEGNTLVLAVIGKLPDRPEPGMLVLMPLGIFLPAGVALQIDNGPEVPLQVQRCIQTSCQVELLLDAEIMNRMKAGTKATVTYAGQNPQGQVARVQAEISLLGFTAALGRVEG